jgi:ATP/maltotriose-dependent transcriptional regulator MalT
MLIELHQRSGDLDEADDMARWALRFAEERGHQTARAQAAIRLSLLGLARGDSSRVRGDLEIAEGALSSNPGHQLWMHFGALRAAQAAEDGDERACRAWWSVTRERGIESRGSDELRPVLHWLCERAAARGWTDIAAKAAAVSARSTGTFPTYRSPMARSRA